MDNSPTLQNSVGGKIYQVNSNNNKQKKNNFQQQTQRNKLVRSTESIGNAFSIAPQTQLEADFEAATATTTKAQADQSRAEQANVECPEVERSVMGGGFAIPPPTTAATTTTTTAIIQEQQEQETTTKEAAAAAATTITTDKIRTKITSIKSIAQSERQTERQQQQQQQLTHTIQSVAENLKQQQHSTLEQYQLAQQQQPQQQQQQQNNLKTQERKLENRFVQQQQAQQQRPTNQLQPPLTEEQLSQQQTLLRQPLEELQLKQLQQQQQQKLAHNSLQQQQEDFVQQQQQQQQMHEKLLECGKEKTDKLKKLLKTKDTAKATTPTTPTKSSSTKPPKETHSKFADKLRRSFRRGEHKSLEIKRPERNFELSATHSPQEGSSSSSSGHFGLKSLPPLHRNSQSIFSLSNLPGLGSASGCGGSAGHINPALLLDSPDEGTPPEFAYQHLSSVATTNSSTSLESNFGDFGERTSSQSSISYWAWQQSSSSMGGEVSTTSSSGAGGTAATGSASISRDAAAVHGSGDSKAAAARDTKTTKQQQKQQKQKLETQSSSKSDTQQQQLQQQQTHQPVGVSHTAASRSCSITSDSSSTKLTRLQNFLFKSSNESSKSFQGHSNEGFTASSHNSSSGEWENLGAYATNTTTTTTTSGSGSQAPADFYVGSFPEEVEDFGAHATGTGSATAASSAAVDSGEAGNYYQYTLTSPNNPFLPEIIARTYHSTYDEEDELDANVTAVKYGVSGGAHSTQLPTPAYSRAGSQESTHSESAVLQHSASAQHSHSHSHSHSPSPSPASSSSSTPGRQKRKLFSLNSPTRHLLHQQHSHQQQQQQQQQKQPPSASTPVAVAERSRGAATVTAKSISASGGFVHSLNPFLSGVALSSSASKRAPLKQSAVTSPIAVPQDLNAKREEFLRATMKICLVVSPPTSKLQLKSKSLTHLDGLDSMIACHHGAAAGKPPTMSYASALAQTLAVLPLPLLSLSQPLPTTNKQQQKHQKQPKPAETSTHHSTSTSHHAATRASQWSQSRQTQRPPPTICTQSPFMHKSGPTAKTSSVAPLSPTKFTNSNHNNNNNNRNNNNNHSTILSSSSCSSITTNNPSSTNTATSCCNSNICCLSGSASIVGVALNSTHTVSHQFQSGNGATSASAFGNGVQQQQQQKQQQQQQQQSHTLNAASLSMVSSGSSGGGGVANASASATNIYAAASATPMGGVMPASHKKKTSFMQRKKPLLTRSEVSSSEYFSVSFCMEQGCQEEEFIAATKGVTLSAALSQALKVRNLSFSQIAITDNNPPTNFLEAGYSPLASSLDENTDVENLAGRHLIITERDGSRKTLQKAASFGSRTRPPRLLSSASTEETTDQAVPGKQLKQRWSGIFGSKNAQQSQLCELLNGYGKNGVPQKSSTLHFDHPALEAALEYLDNMHKSWKDFVNSDSMNDNEMRIQTAIWELVTTEVYYIHALQTVTDLFLACLEAVQAERLLTDVDQHRLFSNVRDICEANLKFWTLYLYPMVAHSVTSREPLRIGFFQQGFVAFATIFAPYKKYCAEQSTCQFYCKELNRTNSLFTSYLAWCEAQKMCNRLRLADILVRPMQRLTKYSLLLAAIKKHMSDVEEVEAVDSMIHTVENFVFSVNNHLTTRQENERLKGVMARIESYDVVDTSNEQLEKMIKQYSQMFDLCAPMKGCPTHHVRHLFMEGDHKFKDNLGKADVHCFLLTDMLLVCKAIAKRGLGSLKVIRQPYLTDRLIVQQTNNILNCVYLNEFQVAITAFTLQCSEAKNWYESLKRAHQIYTRLKQGSSNWDSFRFGGSGTSGGAPDSLGVKKSPMNSSLCSHVSSANNSHSGSVEWNDSRNISVDFEKTNSLSSDEGSMGKNLTANAPLKLKINPTSANTLSVQPLNHLGQSLPNLNLNHSHTNLYHSYSNNTLLVPGTAASHSGNLLLSISHRGISYPPPSPTRVPLRRGMAFSTSTKNPPLVKTRNITSQNSINLQQTPIAVATAPTPAPSGAPSQETLPANSAAAKSTGSHSPTAASAAPTTFASDAALQTATALAAEVPAASQLSYHNLSGSSCQLQQRSNETDV